MGLAAVRWVSARWKLDLGKNQNSSSLVIGWGRYWVAGCVMTLWSSQRLQFIGSGREHNEFERRIVICKTGWVTSGRATWLLPWRDRRRSPDMWSTVSRDVVKRLDTRRTTVMVQRRWESYPRDQWARGGGTAASRNSLLTGAYLWRRYLRDPERYPSTCEHESPHRRESWREGRRRRGDKPEILLQSPYHGVPFQLTSQSNLEHDLLSISNDNSSQALQQNWRAINQQ
jgi:hypothetical protein